MRNRAISILALSFVLGLGTVLPACEGDTTCESGDEGCGLESDDALNPFLVTGESSGKVDTAYENPDGVEVEVDLEADVEGVSYRADEAPALVSQFALTYLRKQGDFYLESLAEAASSAAQVEWRVDGAWIPASDAADLDSSKLTHFRMKGVNAVLLFKLAKDAKVGKVFKAKVPRNPFGLMSAAGNTCADEDGHMSLSESVYWYMWNPEKSGCKATLQDMSVTVSKVLPGGGKLTYPEYDLLVKDGKVTAVVLFGQIGDDPLKDSDPGIRGPKTMASWLTRAGWKEVTPAPVGRRFTKHIGQVDFEIDLYSAKEFAGLSDMGNWKNFEKAIAEHEIVTYDGHSMLGASDFWSRPKYPDYYQIFLYGGCLGYEYYVRPILGGKGGWDKVDILSSVVEVSAGANEFAGPILAKIAWALDHGYNVSWKDLLVAVRQGVGDSTFGVSGVRDNCFSPSGSLCTAAPTGEALRLESAPALAIPDMDANGVTDVIEVADARVAKSVTVELDITHTYVGDLKVTVSHGGVDAVVWKQAGGAGGEIKQSFTLKDFAGKDASGAWTLKVADLGAQDTGTVNSWALVIE